MGRAQQLSQRYQWRQAICLLSIFTLSLGIHCAWAQGQPAATQTVTTVDQSATTSGPVVQPVATTIAPAQTTTTQTTTVQQQTTPVVSNAAPQTPAANPNDDAELQSLTAALEKSLEKISDKKPPEQEAFDNALKGAFPMSPAQIREVMRRMSESQKAASPPPDPDPKAEVKVENISLEPGVAPPTIRVAVGYVTTMTVTDSTGEPWPVEHIVVGGNFSIPGPTTGHIVRIIPQTRYGKGNLSVTLQGLSTPLTFKIEAGKDTVYYRYDVRVPAAGPAATTPILGKNMYTDVAGKDDAEIAVLSGLPPKNAKQLEIAGTDKRTKVWLINAKYYVRTPLTLLSPAWDSSIKSADGTTVYVLEQTPVLLMSDAGQMLRIKVIIPPENNFKTDEIAKGELILPASEALGANNGIGSSNPIGATANTVGTKGNKRSATQAVGQAGNPLAGTPGSGNTNPPTIAATGAPDTTHDLENILGESDSDNTLSTVAPVRVQRSPK